MKKITEELIIIVGTFYTAKFIFTLIFSLIGTIPFIKEYNKKKDLEFAAQIKQEEILYKKSLIGKYAVQPYFDQYDGLLRAYSRVQFPAAVSNSLPTSSSMLLVYNSLENCNQFLKIINKKDQECKKFSN